MRYKGFPYVGSGRQEMVRLEQKGESREPSLDDKLGPCRVLLSLPVPNHVVPLIA